MIFFFFKFSNSRGEFVKDFFKVAILKKMLFLTNFYDFWGVSFIQFVHLEESLYLLFFHLCLVFKIC